jgi:hypothetical protein
VWLEHLLFRDTLNLFRGNNKKKVQRQRIVSNNNSTTDRKIGTLSRDRKEVSSIYIFNRLTLNVRIE